MALPQFKGAAILDIGGNEARGDRNTRFFTGSLPGVNGVFIQNDGFGGQRISVTGWLTAANHAAIITKFHTMSVQEGDVGTYTGPDGIGTTNVLLRSVIQIGRVTKLIDNSYSLRVRFDFVWLTPS